ncbi:hypothetical protein A3848_29520 [Paenibacillus sp. P32E]|nr:hypothetical protein A3848_29520 [Paenibacillus sp. P32E]
MIKRSMVLLLALFILVGTIPVYAGASSTNLALNKTATASSVWGGYAYASYAVDGNSGSEWGPANTSTPPWLKVDLGSVTQFNKYAVETLTGRYNSAIKLEISNDDLTWAEVDTVSGNTNVKLSRTLPQPVSARYVKVTITAWSLFPDITEFELYSDIPSAPTGLTATAGDSQVTLNWSGVSNATSYDVYQGSAPGVYDVTPVANLTGTTATIAGLTNGETYYFAVKSSKNNVNSAYSNEVSAIPQMPAPAAPTGLTVTAGDGQATLSWNGAQGAADYALYSRTAGDSYDHTPVATVSGATYTYTVTGLTNGTTYNFVVKATNAGGSSGSSNEVSAIPQMPAPAAPTGLAAAAGDGQATLSWNGAQGAAGYALYSRTAGDSYDPTPVATVSGATYTYTVTGLTNGTTYKFVVKASNPGGSSGSSNEVSATPQVPVPGAPVLLPVTASNSKVSLTWNSIDGSTGYKIYKSTTSGAYGAEEATVSSSTYSYDVTGLENGTPYYFVVKATNPGGDSAASNEVSAIPVTVPASPTNVSATAGNGQATISFDIPSVNGGSPITNYEVISSPGNISAVGTASPITVEGLTNGVTYTFTVKAVNALGSGTASAASNAVALVVPPSEPTPKPTVIPTPTPTPTPTVTPTPADNAFNSSIIDEVGLVSAIGSKIAEAIKAGVKNDLADSKGHWAEKTIETFVNLNFIRGYENGQFKPNGNITRAEFAMLISRVFDMSATTGPSVAVSDISSHWAKEAIEELVGAGVLSGYGDGTFRPNQAISREEIAVLVSRIVNLSAVNKDDSRGDFTDLSNASSYAAQAIKDIAKAGIVNGMNDGTFNPHGKATRAEAITIILNTLSLNPQIKDLLDSLN